MVTEQPPTTGDKKSRPIAWYRTPLEPAVLKDLHERSDWMGLLQSVGYLGVLVLTGATAFYSAWHWPVWITILLVFLHGTCFAFQINAVHELGHNTVFKTQWLNGLFVRIFAFLGWMNFELFHTSHARHHRYTLHPPDDLEVVLPIKIMVKQFFQSGFVNVLGPYHVMKDTIRIARGKLCGEWELARYPESDPAERRPPVNWARTVLLGQALIIVASFAFKLWMLPLLITFAPFYGGWLFFVCNNTQHIGLQDNVPDFRLCCRTFILNPVARFLYWHMNYHTEHHMYAAVPCYKLGKLHQAIKHDLPPCPRGIVATWKEIAAIQKLQKENPKFQHVALLPGYPAN